MRVDFYRCAAQNTHDYLLFACQLLESAYQQDRRVFVYCQQQTIAHQLDELLWTFKDDSFIAHNLQGEGPFPSPAVQIGLDSASEIYQDILLNLHDTAPEWHTRFKQIIEIIPDIEEIKVAARQRYRLYQQQQYELKVHPSTQQELSV